MEIQNDKGIFKWFLIGLCTLFLAVMLVLPLVYVIYTALREGFGAYLAAVTDTYAVKAILLTVKVVLITVAVNSVFGLFAAWLITKFQFRGKKIISTLIDLPLTLSVPAELGSSDHFCGAGHRAGDHFCDIPVHLAGDHPGADCGGNG
jgi:sulfate transport system permease protein